MKRIAAPLVRHLLGSYRQGVLSASDAAEELHLSRSRFYRLYSDYLRACAQKQEQTWQPGLSGGDHRAS